MSCTICGQDVPVVPTAEDADLVTCVRCRAMFSWAAVRRRNLRLDQYHGSCGETSPAAVSHPEPPPLIADDDDWDAMYHPTDSWRHDTPPAFPAQYRIDRTDPQPTSASTPTHRRTPSNWLQWIVLSLGAALFSCGAALIAWSFGDDRQDLWNIGAPMALAGQAAFLIGLVLQLDILWQESKQTGRRLEQLDRCVSPISGSTVSKSQIVENESAQRSAKPQDAESLLKELKGQLDRMATRLSRHKH